MNDCCLMSSGKLNVYSGPEHDDEYKAYIALERQAEPDFYSQWDKISL